MEIYKQLKELKQKFLKDGIEIIGIFGSIAKNKNDEFSDIDIAYKINYNIFFKKYKDGFSQILKLEEIKKILENNFHKKVDFILFNDKISKDIKYV